MAADRLRQNGPFTPPFPERLSGTDALLYHAERLGHPAHTLKIVVLDPSRLGRQITPADLEHFVRQTLGDFPRLAQRVGGVRPFTGRPFWLTVPDFDPSTQIDERVLPAPGDQRQLDHLCSELATDRLDLTKPLWTLTLVSGLSGGRQAVIARIHHAIGDGLSAMNGLRHLTTEEPAERAAAEKTPAPAAAEPPTRFLRRVAASDTAKHLARFPGLLVTGGLAAVRAARYRSTASHLPRPGFTARNNFLTAPIGPQRVCAMGALPLAQVKSVATAAGVTVNGVLHALLATALREELLRRGEDVEQPLIACFGIAQDGTSRHRQGNFITPTFVALHVNEADPLMRLLRTGASAREGVALRKASGLHMAGRWNQYVPRLAPAFIRIAKHRINSNAHVVTANVPGPTSERWIGPVRITDWYSYAIVLPPVDLNVTIHGYADHLRIGLLTAPEVTTHPHGLVAAMQAALDELTKLTAMTSRTTGWARQDPRAHLANSTLTVPR
jgi:WS/DGAT/MGAT family acyltransferase